MSTLIPNMSQQAALINTLTSAAAGNWLHVVSHLDPKYGGISTVVPELISAIGSAGHYHPSLAGFCSAGEQRPRNTQTFDLRVWPSSRIEWLRNASLTQDFNRVVAGSEGLHIHGLWEQSTLVAAKSARKSRKPYVLSAHGMLERWALQNKRLKKSIYAAFVERTNVEGAACLHALTSAEAEDYRRFGSRRPIAVIPNGVHVPAHADAASFLNEFPSLRGKKLVLFLGRIHFKKGLDLLCHAWQTASKRWPEAHLVLAGPDFGTRASIEALVQSLNLSRRITFTGMLTGDLKWSALKAAQCFVLPSYSEGLSVSTLEALGMGVPVIITEHCHLPEVQQQGCGWVIPANANRLAETLDQFLSSSSNDLLAMSSRARQMVEQSYTWPKVGAQMCDLYRWLEGGPLPNTCKVWEV